MAGRLPVFPAGRWSEGVEWLRAACDAPADREREDEAARLATLLFDELDRHDLATYAARRLVAADSAVEALGRAVRAAEDQLTHEPELFRAAAPLAVALLGLYRDDLGEFDPALFQTTLKHGRLEELLDELGARPALPRIVPPRCEPRPTDPWPILSQPTLSLAAASSAFDPLARLRAELAVRESPVPGVPGLAVSLDVVAHRDVLAHRDRPPDVQVRLRGPDDARGRFGTATLAVPGGPELTAELIRGRGRFPVHPDQLAAGGWRLTLTDRGGRAYLIDREE
jgi:hypothetical protein